MQGVKTIDRTEVKPHPRKTNAFEEKQDEDLQDLKDILSGKLPLDYSASDEYIEGRAQDCSRLQLSKLKAGDFAVESHIDLHGKNREEAKLALNEFFSEALMRGRRCVLVICGRGLRSPGGKPVLKELLVKWLLAGSMSRNVQAFCTAKAHDGGLGAVYVLLRCRTRK